MLYLWFPGLLHDDLKVFLTNNVPQGKKKSKVVLGVADTKLGASILEIMDIHCQTGIIIMKITDFLHRLHLQFPFHRWCGVGIDSRHSSLL